MEFPVPSVAGVFLSLSNRLKTAITDGSAAHYLLGRTPTRLRNHLGFHAALAEMADALLERAVIPYQTTQSLSSLSVLPTADFPGCGHTPTLYAPVSFEPAIADSEKRSMLGHEKRLAPLEFWRAMLLGSDRLARVCNPVPFTNGVPDEGSGSGSDSDSGDEPDVLIYPSVLYPRQGVKERRSWGETYAYGFYDLMDTGWCETDTFPDGWSPSEFGPVFAPTSTSYLGRAALEVFSTVDFPSFSTWAGASLPMVAGLAGFRMVADERVHGQAIWPWQYGGGGWVTIHGGYQFTGKIATLEHFDWEHKPDGPAEEITSTPYNFDFVGDIAFPRMQLAAAKAYNGLGGEDPSPNPWISPFLYRRMVATARANLDVLRIQQVLLGLFWANWARMPVVVKVPHVAEKVVRTWHVDEYGNVGEPYDTPVQDYPKSCSDLSVDQECQWRLSLDPDPEYSRRYGCSATLYYVVPFWWPTNETHESGVESYPYLDGLDADGVGIGRAEVQRIVDDAKDRKQRAEQDIVAAEADIAAAEQQLAGAVGTIFANAFAAAPNVDHWTDSGEAPLDRSPGAIWEYRNCYCHVDVTQDGRTYGFTRSVKAYRAPNPDDDDVPGPLLVADTAREILGELKAIAEGWSIDRPLTAMEVSGAYGGPTFIVPQDVVDQLSILRQARYRIMQAESEISEVSDTVEFGVKVDIGPELFRRILSRHDDLLYTVIHGGCDEDSASLLSEGMAWLTEHGNISGWTPADPQGGYDYTEVAYRRAPVLDSESCPVRVYLAHLLTEGVSPWPAESAVNAEYVKTETVALGMTMLDEARGYYRGQDGIESDFDDDDPVPFCRRVAMSDAPEPGVSAPAETIRGILAALVANFPDLPMRAASAVSNGRFDSLLFAEPSIVTGGAPNLGWNVRPAYAWYHPDRGPDVTGPYQWLDPSKLWPYRVTGEQLDGTDSECSLEENDSFLFYLVVDAYFNWCSLIVTPPLGFHDQMTLHIGKHAAVRAEWDWKSMPTDQE